MFKFSVAATTPFLLLSISLTARAQIIPDTTLPTNSIVSPEGNTSVITGGTQAGGNLFHSFEQFSIPTGTGAYFNNNLDIQNIFSRVTGGSISNIDGFIRANGTANLFLVNPNGIIFGPNASLELGGSFVGSSADRLLFEDGSFYSATETQTEPLLTINVPIGLQFGGNPGAIVNRSRLAAFDPNTPPQPIQPLGLSISPGNTIALLGGNLVFEGGTLAALDGSIELGSVGANSRVNLTAQGDRFALGYEEVENFGDIEFSNAASVRSIDLGRGRMQIRGRQIVLDENSIVNASNIGTLPGNLVTVTAQEALELRNFSQLSVETFDVGSGGDLLIETGQLSITGRAFAIVGSRSQAPGGDLTVRSRESVVVSGAAETSESSLFVGRFDTGNFDLTVETIGDLTIETQQLSIDEGAKVGRIGSNANGGNVIINASESVEVVGSSADGFISQLWSIAGRLGNAGNLTIDTGRLAIRDGGQVFTGTFGRGNSGSITVRARDSVELIGTTPNRLSSSLAAISQGMGNAGNITIETDRLTVRDGSVLSVASLPFVPVANSGGNAGTLTVRANEIEVSGSNNNVEFPFSVSLISAETNNAGNGGTILLEVDRLSLRNGGRIAGTTSGSGDGGTLIVRASSVEVSGRTPAPEQFQYGPFIVSTNGSLPSTLGVATVSDGNAGEISIETDRLSVADGALITAETLLGSGEGGNIRIRASEAIELRDDAQVNVESRSSGNPGSIQVSTDFLRLENQGVFNATSTTGRGGNIDLAASNIQLRHQSQITSAGSPNLPTTDGNIGINAETLVLLEGSQILTSSTDPQGGSNIAIAPLNTSDLVILQSADSRINARGELTISGEIQPEPANLPQVETTDAESLLSRGCQDYQGSSFYVTGRGGIPPSPFDPLGGSAVVEIDWVEASEEVSEVSENTPNEVIQSPQSPLIEAQGWIVGENGEILLTAAPYRGTPYAPGMPTANCFSHKDKN